MLAAVIIKGNMYEGLLFATDFVNTEAYNSLDTELWSLPVCLFVILFVSFPRLYLLLIGKITF